MKNIPLLSVIIFLSLCVGGCGKTAEKTLGDAVVATVGKYELTVNDYNDEARFTAAHKYLSGDVQKAKEAALDEIITRKILIQEAQRQDFDKDRAFMKEIERYWEQALLKLLMKKKLDEISRSAIVTEAQMKARYEEMERSSRQPLKSFAELAPAIRDDIIGIKKREYIETWIDQLRAHSDVKVRRDILDKIKVE